MKQSKQPNKDYINQSLLNQIAESSMKIAERDSIITELYQELDGLKQELDEYRKNEIEKMDSAE